MIDDRKDAEKEFNYNKFWGSSLIAQHVVFRRNSNMYCVYCGEEADTREHCPSRVFLKKPLPTDLPTVPACKKCNNGFSQDERYTYYVVKYLHEYYTNKQGNVFEIVNSDLLEEKEAKKNAKQFVENPFFDDKMANIFRKLAICHAAYEISMGYYSKDWKGKPLKISYSLRPLITQDQWNALEYTEEVSDEILPEVGSRAFRNIYVVQVNSMSVKNHSEVKIPLVMIDWIDIEDGIYKYQVYIKQNQIWVKMILWDFLYCEIVFAPDGDAREY